MKKKILLPAIYCCIMIVILSIALIACSFPEEEKENVPDKYVAEWNKDGAFDINDSVCVVNYEKKDNTPLKVLQITDVHYDDHNKEQSRREQVKQMIREMVADAEPDIIALTGDWSSNSYYLYSYENVPEGVTCPKDVKQDAPIKGLREQRSREIFDLIEELCAQYDCKWAPVFGNHDAEGDVSKYQYADIFAEYENCLFKAGYSNIKGVGNYVVTITHNGKLLQSLFFLDSHSAIDGGLKYDYLGISQIDWYKWCVKGLNDTYRSQGGEGVIPGMMYIHVPLEEYKNYSKVSGTQNHIIGLNREPSYPPYRNSGMFDAIKELNSTKAVFAGHDHDNSATIRQDGVLLCYGVQSGWCDEYAQYAPKGALLATFDKSGKVLISHNYYPILNIDEVGRY